jgi:hypothetical protein
METLWYATISLLSSGDVIAQPRTNSASAVAMVATLSGINYHIAFGICVNESIGSDTISAVCHRLSQPIDIEE